MLKNIYYFYCAFFRSTRVQFKMHQVKLKSEFDENFR